MAALGGAIAGLVIYCVFTPTSRGNQYFLRAGFTFGVIAVGLGVRRACSTGPGSDRRARRSALGAAGLAFAVVLVLGQLEPSRARPRARHRQPPVPLLGWAWRLGVLAAIGAATGTSPPAPGAGAARPRRRCC